MHIIGTIFIGFLVGLFARAIMPGRDPLGIIFTILLGIGGALVGNFIGRALGIYGEGQTVGFLGSLIGALILLYIYNIYTKRTTRP